MRLTRSQTFARAALIGLLPAVVVAALLMYIAWQHNPQGEFHESGRIHWGDWLLLGFVYALPVWLIGATVAAVVLRGRSRGH
jgi:hypothetical protein